MGLLDDPLQLLIVGAIVIIFFVMGPKKIPELARAIGQARGEFAAGAAQKPSQGPLSSIFTTLAAGAPSAELVDAAERLGIPTTGKTSQEITDEIVRRANANN